MEAEFPRKLLFVLVTLLAFVALTVSLFKFNFDATFLLKDARAVCTPEDSFAIAVFKWASDVLCVPTFVTTRRFNILIDA